MTDGETPAGASGGSHLFTDGSASGAPEGGTTAPVGPELRRNDDRRALAGVCAGLGEYTRVDPVVWRTAFVLTAFAGGSGLLLYIAAWMLMRDPQGGPATFEQMLNRSIPPYAVLKLLTVGLAVATGFSLVGGFGWGTLLLAIPLVLGLLTARNRGVDLRTSLMALRSDLAAHEPPPTGPVPQPVPAYYNPAQPWASATKGPVDLAVVSERTSLGADDEDEDGEEEEEDRGDRWDHGGARDHKGRGGSAKQRQPKRAALASYALWTVVTMAVVWALAAPELGAPFSEASTTELLFGPEFGVYFMAAALGVIGLYSLLGTWAGHPRGLAFLGTLAVLAGILVASVDTTRLRLGEERWAPSSAAEAASDDMWLNVGAGRLDLTALPAGLEPGQSVDVAARVDVGDLTLVLPDDARVNLVAQIGIGSLQEPDAEDDSRFGVSLTHEQTFEPMGPLEPVDGVGDTGADEDPGGTDEDGETEEPVDGADDGAGQDGVPVINVHTSTKAGTLEVRYDQAQN
ncbi:PspC domain-containing protein [Nocardiopsis ganjiahuensis]|uniref:PspC domain-containing protein n=1 Tax=Nocardiopsis ganjiahuensis TaxID=239984 RepID=UPI00034AE506|nr:PspC domain-containing protein [Nocardiopsis ganjiahuensis]